MWTGCPEMRQKSSNIPYVTKWLTFFIYQKKKIILYFWPPVLLAANPTTSLWEMPLFLPYIKEDISSFRI